MAATERGAGGAFEYNGFAVGPRRYGAVGSTTATSGAVDKTGYVQREARKKARKKVLSGMLTTDPLSRQQKQPAGL